MANPDRRLATIMIAISWLFMLGIVAVLFGHWLQGEENPNQQVQTVVTSTGAQEIVLKRNRYHHYVTSGQVNGHDVTFMLDTGATSVSIPARVAERIGLQRGAPLTVSTAAGDITVYATTLDSLSVGDLVLHNISATINPEVTDSQILLGMSALRELEFSQRNDTLTLRYQP